LVGCDASLFFFFPFGMCPLQPEIIGALSKLGNLIHSTWKQHQVLWVACLATITRKQTFCVPFPNFQSTLMKCSDNWSHNLASREIRMRYMGSVAEQGSSVAGHLKIK
jgi:hypothetical protein